jgi:hypothetical protein
METVASNPHVSRIVELAVEQEARNQRHQWRPIEQIHERCGDARTAKKLRAQWRQALIGISHMSPRLSAGDRSAPKVKLSRNSSSKTPFFVWLVK